MVDKTTTVGKVSWKIVQDCDKGVKFWHTMVMLFQLRLGTNEYNLQIQQKYCFYLLEGLINRHIQDFHAVVDVDLYFWKGHTRNDFVLREKKMSASFVQKNSRSLFKPKILPRLCLCYLWISPYRTKFQKKLGKNIRGEGMLGAVIHFRHSSFGGGLYIWPFFVGITRKTIFSCNSIKKYCQLQKKGYIYTHI